MFQTFSDTGLSHAQLTALVVVFFRRKLHWGWIVAISLFVMGVSAGYEWVVNHHPPAVAAAYLVCLGLFWNVPSSSAGIAALGSALTGLVRLIIVKPIARQRPSNLSFSQPMEQVFGNSSFPSGHTTTCFAIAAFLLWALPAKQRTLGLAILGWATLVGLSRIYVGVHYPTDVLGGALLGGIGGTIAWMVVANSGSQAQADPSTETAGSGGS